MILPIAKFIIGFTITQYSIRKMIPQGTFFVRRGIQDHFDNFSFFFIENYKADDVLKHVLKEKVLRMSSSP